MMDYDMLLDDEEKDSGLNEQEMVRFRFLISLLPVFFAFLLLIVNPTYISQLFIHEAPFLIGTFPCGWFVLGLILMMMFCSYMVDIFARFMKRHSERGRFFDVLIIIFMFLFALVGSFFVVLGPAAFQVARSGVVVG